MHESDIAIKNEIAKAVVNMGQSKDVIDLSSIISPKINIDLESLKPKTEKHFWLGNIKITFKIRWFLF